MSRTPNISRKCKTTDKLTKACKPQLVCRDLPAGDTRAQFDFGTADVCLNVTTKFPPEPGMSRRKLKVPKGTLLYILRHPNGQLCMMTDCYWSMIDYCAEHKLTYHCLQ